MKSYTAAVAIAFAALLGGASAQGPQRFGAVCPDPDRPCPGFRDHDLSFVLPSDAMGRAEAVSDSFFAVILRSGPRCSIAEGDRLAAQAVFPRNKVFSHRFECDDDVENNVTYTNVNRELAFLAVYAGRTRAQARPVLAEAARRFPGANLRRMRVVFAYP